MFPILRYILIATVLLLAYLAALVVYLVPYAWLVPVGIGLFLLCRKTYRYTAYGTSRFQRHSSQELEARQKNQSPRRFGRRLRECRAVAFW